jgi:hypothetical protein
MKLMVSAGFGESISGEWCDRVGNISMGPRQDMPHGADDVYVRKLVENVTSRDFHAMFIIGGWMYLRDDGSVHSDKKLQPNPEHVRDQAHQIVYEWKQKGAQESRLYIEIGNELDLSYWQEHLDDYHRMAMMCHEAVRKQSSDVRIVTGSTSNFRKKGLFWQNDHGYEILEKLCSFDWPDDTLQGLHPYRTGHRQSEWPSFSSSEDALKALRKLLHGRKLAVTEMGWHESEKWSREDVANFTQDEIKMWRDFGADVFVLYQIQDGLGSTGEDRFGAYTAAGDPRPVAAIMSDWKGELA